MVVINVYQIIPVEISINISYFRSPFVFFFAFFSDLDRCLLFEDVSVSVEGLGSEFEDVGWFGCGESSEEFAFLAVERLGDARSSPYPVNYRSQQCRL